MEGNYAKVFNEPRDALFDPLYGTLQETLKRKQREIRESCGTINRQQTMIPTVNADSAMGIISNMVGYAVDLERII